MSTASSTTLGFDTYVRALDEAVGRTKVAGPALNKAWEAIKFLTMPAASAGYAGWSQYDPNNPSAAPSAALLAGGTVGLSQALLHGAKVVAPRNGTAVREFVHSPTMNWGTKATSAVIGDTMGPTWLLNTRSETLKNTAEKVLAEAQTKALSSPSASSTPAAPPINITTPKQDPPVVNNNITTGNPSGSESPKDWKAMIQGGVKDAVGNPNFWLGAAITLPAVAALYQISRAAGVIGDQKSVRLSASLRKRRGQATDLNFGLAPYKAPKDVANTNPMAKRLDNTGGSDDLQYLDEEE